MVHDLITKLRYITDITDKTGDAQKGVEELYKMSQHSKSIKTILMDSHLSQRSDHTYYENWGKRESFDIDANVVYMLVDQMIMLIRKKHIEKDAKQDKKLNKDKKKSKVN